MVTTCLAFGVNRIVSACFDSGQAGQRIVILCLVSIVHHKVVFCPHFCSACTVMYTNDCRSISEKCKIVKYADHMTIFGLCSNNDSEYKLSMNRHVETVHES